MIMGDRLRALREEKKFSQGDIEKRTGLLRCYISRVENGHTVPAMKRLRNWLALWKSLFINSSMTEKNPPCSPTFRSAKAPTISFGAASGKRPVFCPSFAGLWVVFQKATADSCFTWLRRCPPAKSSEYPLPFLDS